MVKNPTAVIQINEISEQGHTTHSLPHSEAIQKLQDLAGDGSARWVYVNNNVVSVNKIATLALKSEDKVLVAPSIMGGADPLAIDTFIQFDDMVDGKDVELSGVSDTSKFLAVLEFIPASKESARSTMAVVFHVSNENKDTLVHYRNVITAAFQKALNEEAAKDLKEYREYKNI